MRGEKREFGGKNPELDLHGMSVDQAKSEIDSFLIEQINAGNGLVKIIHGWGTGKLQKQIGEYLRTHEDVKQLHPTANPGQPYFLVEIKL